MRGLPPRATKLASQGVRTIALTPGRLGRGVRTIVLTPRFLDSTYGQDTLGFHGAKMPAGLLIPTHTWRVHIEFPGPPGTNVSPNSTGACALNAIGTMY